MRNGTYTTKAGSMVEISGKHSGRVAVRFDWMEEENACFDCQVNPYPENEMLTWNCDVCGGGAAKLELLNRTR